MVSTFNGNPKTTIVSCYSPSDCSGKIEAVEFHSMLQDAIRQLPKYNFVVIDGDMNAQVGSEDIGGFSFHDKTNRNGIFLLDLTKETELVSRSTKFQKKRKVSFGHIHIPTEKEHNPTISSTTRSGNSAMDCQSYNTTCSVQSDHRPSTAKIRLSLTTCRMPKTKKFHMTGRDYKRTQK